MSKFRWSVAVLAALVGTSSGTVSVAKPPDLPAENDVQCQDGREEAAYGTFTLGWDVLSGNVWTKNEPKGQPSAEAVCVGVLCPNVPLLVQWLYQRAQTTAAARNPSTAGVVRDAVRLGPNFAATAEQARQLYEISGRCVREGNLEQARACLRQAHLANPTCRFGRLAIERLQQLESNDAEACEEPGKPAKPNASPRPRVTDEPPLSEEPQSDDEETSQAERSLRQLRNTTVPLGLVPAKTY
jgi:hypothetical protein